MLEITIPGGTLFDETKSEFLESKSRTLQLEHSLISISRWESKWCKVFLSKKEKTQEEILDYVRCMTINPSVDPELYKFLKPEHYKQITEYIENPRSATKVPMEGGSKNSETITSELIYYWMIVCGIDIKCETWHLNRLLTLIRIWNIKNQPKKKRNTGEQASQRAALNAERRAKSGSKG